MLARIPIISLVVLGLLGIGFVVFTTGIHPRSYSIPSGSMPPTIVPGDYIFASGDYYRGHTPVPGDIVLSHLPREGS